MTVPESGALADMFRHFARREFHGHSVRYEFLAEQLTDRPTLAAPLLAATLAEVTRVTPPPHLRGHGRHDERDRKPA